MSAIDHAGGITIVKDYLRDSWAAAEVRLRSGADQSALIRWLETLVPSAPKTDV